MQSQKEHWRKLYQTRQADAVSWFQAHATPSLELICSIETSADALHKSGTHQVSSEPSHFCTLGGW